MKTIASAVCRGADGSVKWEREMVVSLENDQYVLVFQNNEEFAVLDGDTVSMTISGADK